MSEIIKNLKAFTVTLYPYQLKKLKEEKAIDNPQGDSDIWILKDEYYDENTGVVLQSKLLDYMEV